MLTFADLFWLFVVGLLASFVSPWLRSRDWKALFRSSSSRMKKVAKALREREEEDEDDA